MTYERVPDFPVSGEHREVVIHGRQVTMKEIPLSVQRDWIIRAMMEQVLHYDDQTVAVITKDLHEQRQQSLPDAEAIVFWPLADQDAEATAANNVVLKKFAFDAFDALAVRFAGAAEWVGWFIAPQFLDGDDTRATCKLGVFVTDNFVQSVIE